MRPVPVIGPRPPQRRRRSDSSRDDILDAAARLFTENGFTATSTRAIALAVGIRQASLYYHFPSKDQLLTELLRRTVEPSLAVAAMLERTARRAVVRLLVLAGFDVRLLCSGPHNLGALYLLPEVRDPRFALFWSDRNRLRDAYARVITAGIAEGAFRPADPVVADLVFALVESVIQIRSEGRPDLDRLADSVPEACLRLLSVSEGEIARAGRTAAVLLREVGPAGP